MKTFINYSYCEELASNATPPTQKELDRILGCSLNLERLPIKDVATLLAIDDEHQLDQLLTAAKTVKDRIYGNRLVIFAPLYVTNLCHNECLYCAFRSSNKELPRTVLGQEQIKKETLELLKTGQKRVLLVAGESYPKEGLQYVFDSIDSIYSVKDGKNSIRRLNVNIAPLSLEEFHQLKGKDIGTYQLFQETYHPDTYAKMHIRGPKSDYEYRLNTIDRAFQSGIDDVGVGVLFGLYDYKFEALALMSHIEHLEKNFGMGPHTISVPRLEPATGSDISGAPPHPIDDTNFKKLIATLRLAVPYTGLILSTRESADFRRSAFDLGISQISAGSKTNPGGYSDQKSMEQFSLGDHRSLDDVVYDICEKGFLPSFCTSCYRAGRTGLDFMEYAKPGDIKKKCDPNALFTFLEYLDDYGSEKTRALGYSFIEKKFDELPDSLKKSSQSILERIKAGARDIYV
jgi:2-iminoacetate synthase